MKEDKPKSELTLLLRQELIGFVIFRHEDKSTYGVPDTSVTGKGKTSWLEIKLANPDFKSHGQQELTMRRLANAGHYARYIIYEMDSDGAKRTRIVHPKDLANWRTVDFWAGFDHQSVLEHIRGVHENDLVR